MLKRFATAAAFILAACVLGAAPTPAAQYTLKMQTYYSPTTAMGAKYFAEQVNKLTGGRVAIQVFTGGELVGSANILKSVRNGMIDIGHGMGHHFTERKTGLLESGLPMSWMSAVEADVLYERRGLKKLFGDDYAKLGVVYLGPTWAAPYHTLSKQPIRSLDDMRKMKIRAVGAAAKMLSAVGVNVVNLPPEDIYMALTTGQIDGVVYGSAAEYKETKFYEVAGWLNVTPLIDPITDTLIINKKLWESLPEDIRAAFLAAAAIGTFTEVMSRVRRCPVTGYVLVALLPLVPGGGIYYAMSYCVAGDNQRFLDTLLHTFGVAAALAVGAMLASSLFRTVYAHLRPAGRRKPPRM